MLQKPLLENYAEWFLECKVKSSKFAFTDTYLILKQAFPLKRGAAFRPLPTRAKAAKGKQISLVGIDAIQQSANGERKREATFGTAVLCKSEAGLSKARVLAF